MVKILNLPQLVAAYLTELTVMIKEEILDLLVAYTTPENVEEVVNLLRRDPNLHPLELSLYISEVVSPELQVLAPVIKELRTTSEDRDVLEDMDIAEKKLINTNFR